MVRFYFAFYQWFKRKSWIGFETLRFFGIMIDEFTDISITCHLVDLLVL